MHNSLLIYNYLLVLYMLHHRNKVRLYSIFFVAQICTKSFVGWGFAPDPTGGAYSAPPDALAGLGGGAQGKGKEGGE